jgi:hypothetical protein
MPPVGMGDNDAQLLARAAMSAASY